MLKGKVIKQQDEKDCGVSCLASIIEYYGGYVPLETLREDTYTTNDGTNAYHLVKTLKKYMFEAEGLKISINDLNNINYPAIGHILLDNKIPHFVVIYGFNNKYVTLMDPSAGMKKIKIELFKEIFTGAIIICNPINKIISIDKPDNINKLFKQIYLEDKNLIKKIILVSIVLTIISIIISFFLKISLNNITMSTYYLNLNSIIILFFILYVFKIFTTYVRNYYELYLNKNIDINITVPFLKHLFNLRIGNIKSRSTGDILERINELSNIKELFINIIISIFLDFILSLSTLIILINLNLRLTILVLIMIIVYIIYGVFITKKIRLSAEEVILKDTVYKSYLYETVSGIQTIKHLNKIDYYLKSIYQKFTLMLKTSFKFHKIILNQGIIKEIINELGMYIILVTGILLIKDNKLSIINLITFTSLVSYLTEPIKNVINYLPKMEYLKQSYKKINDFIVIEEENLNDGVNFQNGDIEVSNLNYSYNGVKKTIDNLSLKINQNEKILLMGKSGAGKSTLCKLLLKLMKYEEGSIKINNIRIEDYSSHSIRDNITYISQEEVLFSDTIKNNLISEENEILNDIIRICQIDKIIDKKPFRLNTYLLEQGSNLSGGEKQKIILARGLLRNSKIIILDEALSEVPEADSKHILKNIVDYFQDRTIIYITHHEIKNVFDRVIYLKGHYE